jgi:hypothetical protein
MMANIATTRHYARGVTQHIDDGLYGRQYQCDLINIVTLASVSIFVLSFPVAS